MKKNLLLLILFVLVFAGCRSSKPVIHQFYLLEPPEQYEGTWPERVSMLPGSCYLSAVQLAPAYASHQIAVREDSHQIRYFSFNEWAVRPEIAFKQLMSDFYDKNQLFRAVKTGRIVGTTDYVLETEVTHVELDTREDEFFARLQLQFLLLDGKNQGGVLYKHHADRSLPLETKNLNHFAAAISKMFTEELHAFSVGVLQTKQ